MKLNFDLTLQDLEGKPTYNGTDEVKIGKILANELAQSREGDAVKFWDWALKLHRGEMLDLDRSDQETLQNFIKRSQTMFVILKAQLLEVFIKADKKELKKVG